MLYRKAISLALCAMMLLSCVMVIGSVEARRMSDWSAPVMLEGGDAQSADSVQVAMNAAGDAVVAWRSYDGD